MNKRKANLDDMAQGVRIVMGLYHSRCLNVIQKAADNEFKCIRDHIRPNILNVVAADEHVSEIERSIRVIKEGVRCRVHSLPYIYYPKNMVAALVISAVKSLNNEVGACTLSERYVLHTLITRYNIPNYEQLVDLSFEDHVEIKNLNERTNSTTVCTILALALYPSGNLQGGWRMMSLNTIRLIYRSRWEKVKMTDALIDRVHEIGQHQRQRSMATNSEELPEDDDKVEELDDERSDTTEGDYDHPTMSNDP